MYIKMACSSSDVSMADEKVPIVDGIYTLICSDGPVRVASTSLKKFNFFVENMRRLDPDNTMRISVQDKFNDVAALFIYICSGLYKVADIPAIIMLLDKWEGTMEAGLKLFTSVRDLKYIPYHTSGYITKMLEEFCDKKKVNLATQEVLDLPDHVLGKLTKILIKPAV